MTQVRRGFTLVELLVAVGIIALLISILLSAVGSVRQQAMSLKCMSQMRQLGNALVLYSNDNYGWLPSSDTCGPLYPANFTGPAGTRAFSSTSTNQTWVGWVDGGPTADALQNGTLWKYLQNAAIFKCPSDSNPYRLRTYSMNSYLCSGTPWGSVGLYFNIYKITQVGNASTAIAFAEETDPRGTSSQNAMLNQWNQNGWIQYPMAADALPALAPTQDYWCDVIASWHRGGANFAFVDGHAEYWRFSDSRTINYLRNDPTWPCPFYCTPHNADLNRVRNAIAPWGVQRTQ